MDPENRQGRHTCSEKGFFRCNFTVPNLVSDSDGNWHVGAIATLIDCIGGAAIISTVENMCVSLDFTVSYFATAKIEEQVEIEAKVEGSKGNLISAMVRVKKKESGLLIALGKLWVATTGLKLFKNSKL